jgi:hypothetical protein
MSSFTRLFRLLFGCKDKILFLNMQGFCIKIQVFRQPEKGFLRPVLFSLRYVFYKAYNRQEIPSKPTSVLNRQDKCDNFL